VWEIVITSGLQTARDLLYSLHKKQIPRELNHPNKRKSTLVGGPVSSLVMTISWVRHFREFRPWAVTMSCKIQWSEPRKDIFEVVEASLADDPLRCAYCPFGERAARLGFVGQHEAIARGV